MFVIVQNDFQHMLTFHCLCRFVFRDFVYDETELMAEKTEYLRLIDEKKALFVSHCLKISVILFHCPIVSSVHHRFVIYTLGPKQLDTRIVIIIWANGLIWTDFYSIFSVSRKFCMYLL